MASHPEYTATRVNVSIIRSSSNCARFMVYNNLPPHNNTYGNSPCQQLNHILQNLLRHCLKTKNPIGQLILVLWCLHIMQIGHKAQTPCDNWFGCSSTIVVSLSQKIHWCNNNKYWYQPQTSGHWEAFDRACRRVPKD